MNTDRSEELIGIVAHDIRNPLAAIIGWLDLIKTHSDQLDPRILQYVNGISESSKQLSIMIDNMLDVNHIENKKITVKLTKEDISNFVYEIVRRYTYFAQDSVITLSYMPMPESITMEVDKRLLGRAIETLIISSINHSPRGMQVTVKTQLSNERNKLLIAITDQGTHIPIEFQKLIFDKNGFIQTRKFGYCNSFGLGLYFCKLVVELHGGTITLFSEKNNCNSFKINLPVKTLSFVQLKG